ncbi:unnamed protein product, partial [Discosporangium mesarthrocarpum]
AEGGGGRGRGSGRMGHYIEEVPIAPSDMKFIFLSTERPGPATRQDQELGQGALEFGISLKVGEGVAMIDLHPQELTSTGVRTVSSLRTGYPAPQTLDALEALAAEVG